jgi:hypothetical protein
MYIAWVHDASLHEGKERAPPISTTCSYIAHHRELKTKPCRTPAISCSDTNAATTAQFSYLLRPLRP